MQKDDTTVRPARADGIQVIKRAAMLLTILAESDAPVRLKTISEQSGLVPSTTRRILASLCNNGMCEQTSAGRYRLGLRLFELGSRVESGFDLRAVSHDLERLSALTQLTVFLCVRHDDRAVVIERIDGEYAFSLALTVGGSLPLHVGAAPRALLAWDTEAQIHSYLHQVPAIVQRTDKTVVDADRLLADLLASRERGYVVSEEDVTPGVLALAMPVFDTEAPGKPLASISIAGLRRHIIAGDEQRLIDLLRETADAVSAKLGFGSLRAVGQPPPSRKGAAA